MQNRAYAAAERSFEAYTRRVRRAITYEAQPFGPLGPLTYILFAAWIYVITFGGALLTGFSFQAHAQARLDLLLFLAVLSAYVVWFLLRWRGHVAQSTGVGFVLASHGLWVRAFAQLPVSFFFYWPPIGVSEDHLMLRAARACYDGGLVAVVMGLTLVSGACAFDRRVRSRVPRWQPRE